MILKNMDYIFFVYGLSFLIMAVMLQERRTVKRPPLPWSLFALFGLLHGINEWLDMLALSFGDSVWFMSARLCVLAASFMFLLEFGRRGAARLGLKMPGTWAVLALTVAGALGWAAGPEGANAGFRHALGLPGGLLAGWVLWKQSKVKCGFQMHAFRVSGIALMIYGVAAGLITVNGGYFPSIFINQESFLDTFGIPIQLVRMACALTISSFLYIAHGPPRDSDESFRPMRWIIPIILIALIATGFWAVNAQEELTDSGLRQTIIHQTSAVARTLNPERIKALSFSAADRKRPEFIRIRAYMVNYKKMIGCSGIYSMALRGDNLVFGPESYDVNTPMASVPGTVYQQPPYRLFGIFRGEQPFAEGPYKDEYGSFVSAFAPVTDPRDGSVLMAVGMDINAGIWQKSIAQSRMMAIFAVISLALTVLAAAMLFQHRNTLSPERQGWLRHLEVYFMAVFGLGLTIIMTGLMHVQEQKAHKDIFTQLAESDAIRVSNMFQNFRDRDLKTLSEFMEISWAVSRTEFQMFSRHIFQKFYMAGIGWAPRVPAANRQAFEARERESDIGDFSIFQKDPLGRISPAPMRGDAYPLLFLEPYDESKNAIGFDTTTEQLRWAAISSTVATGMATATDVVLRISNNEPTINVYEPVFNRVPNASRPARKENVLGVVFLTLRISDILKEALIGHDPDNAVTMAQLLQTNDGESTKLLASTDPPETSSLKLAGNPRLCMDFNHGDICATFPLFMFGKTYILVITPGPAFASNYPRRARWSAAIAGLLITALLSVLSLFLTIRRADLEIKVVARTSQLAASEERLRATLRSIGDGVVSTDANGLVINLNAAAETLTGWTTLEAFGRPINEVFNIICSQTRMPVENPVFRAIKEERVIGLANHTALIARDGIERQIADSCAPIMGPESSIIGAVLVFRDVTAEYEAREEIKEANERFNQLALQGRIIAWEVDPSGLYTYVNEVMETVLGYKAEELVGKKHFYELHPLAGRTEFIRNAFESLESQEPFRDVEHLHMAKSGKEIWLSTSGSPLFDHNGAFMGYRGANIDITERKRAEEEILRSREQFILAVEGSNDGIWDWDIRDGSLYLSPKWKRMIGYENKELLNTFETFEEHLHPDDRLHVMDYVERYLKGEFHHYSIEFRFRKKDGDYLWILARGTALRDENGKPYRMAGSHTDITERKRAEVELLEANKRLKESMDLAREMAEKAEAANTAKSEFLANMSHEIRTPMNGVIGMTGLLLDTELNQEQLQYAQIVRTSAEALLSLINDILDFSKIEAKKLELENLNFDLRQTLEDTTELIAVKAQEKDLDIVCLIDPKAPLYLKGDPGRLRQILINLGGNAVKFTERGGITLAAQLESDDGHEARILFSVTDTGMGIPMEKQGRLFTPFFQVDGSTTRKFGGTGLGLAISKQLAELMGGVIGLSSEEGRGATFWFTAVFEKQTDLPEAENGADVSIAGTRMLVVDDHEVNRLLVTTLLSGWGCRYQEAADAGEAIVLMNQAVRDNDPFDVALLDMQMPNMNGAELGQRIKASPQLKATKLVMMTSMSEQGDVRRLTQVGFEGYLTKPLRKALLKECLVMVLGRKEADAAKTVQPAPAPAGEEIDLSRKSARILLVEDNATNQLVALKILEKLGYKAEAVGNGKEAVDALQAIPYDLVLMDCQMPEMDGFEATRIIRSWRAKQGAPLSQEELFRDKVSRIPVVAMTAHAMKGDREKCIEAGMDDYLSKPVNPKDLAQVLKRRLLKRKTHMPLFRSVPDYEAPAWPAPPAEEPGEPKVQQQTDYDKEGFLARIMGKDDLAKSIIEIFLADMPKQMEGLLKAIEAGKMQEAEQQAHKIKGAAANVGGEALRATAFEMEKEAKSGGAGSLKTLFAELEERFERLKNAMKKEHPGV